MTAPVLALALMLMLRGTGAGASTGLAENQSHRYHLTREIRMEIQESREEGA
jgi:hypothetical protein